MTKEEIKEYNHQYYLNHKQKMIENAKKWAKENPEKRTEISKNWAENNYYKVVESRKKWKEKNPNYDIEYNKTEQGRANKLVIAYKRSDEMYERGKCTLTGAWIVDNIFSKTCHYCGETDWHKLGCDRIDNSKPHTADNVIPCCSKCNTKRNHKEYNDFIKELENERREPQYN